LSSSRSLPVVALTVLFAATGLTGSPFLAQGSSQPKDKPGPQTSSSPASPEAAGIVISDERLFRDVKYWETQLAADPENVTIRLALGNAHALNNQPREAVRAYRKVLRDYPDYKIAWNNLGSAYRSMGRGGQAFRAFRKAIDLDPRYALAHYNLGVVYDADGHYNKALEEYGLALKYQPNLIEVKTNPQVVTNRHLYAVLLKNYVDSEGGLAVPLEMAYPTQPKE